MLQQKRTNKNKSTTGKSKKIPPHSSCDSNPSFAKPPLLTGLSQSSGVHPITRILNTDDYPTSFVVGLNSNYETENIRGEFVDPNFSFFIGEKEYEHRDFVTGLFEISQMHVTEELSHNP